MSHRQLQELRKEIELNAELISDVDYQSVMAEIEDRIEILSAENAV
jgi:hypothetical protein